MSNYVTSLPYPVAFVSRRLQPSPPTLSFACALNLHPSRVFRRLLVDGHRRPSEEQSFSENNEHEKIENCAQVLLAFRPHGEMARKDAALGAEIVRAAKAQYQKEVAFIGITKVVLELSKL